MLSLGLVYLPQDRRDEALALNRSVVENVSLEVLDQPRFVMPGGLVRDTRLRETVDAIADRLDISTGVVLVSSDLLESRAKEACFGAALQDNGTCSITP